MSNEIEIIGIVVMTIALSLIARFGRRTGIVEARFDSKTGKLIK